ncbi:zinc finger protein [Plectosphaerella plurivora]|uniref:Zinc finger protein n=1 Tax=Plectosphaerella plurivora TaxID=936078 RepID=A0A9P8VLR3_9PEZI|nr:zinc finger protein [Plectosphaerella plurivora]
MAADLIMPSMHDPRLQSQYFATAYPIVERPHLSHARSQSYQFAPTEVSQQQQQQHTSPLSSGHGSPTSPGSGRMNGTRQNRPLIVPAVLRPNHFFQPANQPRSPKNENGPDADDLTLRRVSSSFISLPGLSMFGSRLTRRSTGDSGKDFTDHELDPELFPAVKSDPSRNHWKPDAHATLCDEPSCKRAFSYFLRRHHCRKCGNIFCDPHTAYIIRLDEDCNYNPRGAPSRACGHCYSEFLTWKSRNNSRAGSDQDSISDGGRSIPQSGNRSTPPSPINGGSPIASNAALASGPGPEVAASVPRDWNWSTF